MDVANLMGGVVVLIIGLVITFFAAQLPYMSEYGPGPGLLPLWIGIVLSGAALGIILKAVRNWGNSRLRFYQEKTRQVIFIFVTIMATLLFLPLLGLSVSLALFSGFSCRTMGKHSWLLCVTIAVVTGAAVRIIFGELLNIPLPKGRFGI